MKTTFKKFALYTLGVVLGTMLSIFGALSLVGSQDKGLASADTSATQEIDGKFNAGEVLGNVGSAYFELEYIGSTGGQFISTGWVPETATSGFEIEFAKTFEVQDDYAAFFATGKSGYGNTSFCVAFNSYRESTLTKPVVSIGNYTYVISTAPGVEEFIKIKYVNKELIINDASVATGINGGFTNPGEKGVEIFTSSWTNTTRHDFVKGKIKSLKFYNGSEVVRNFVPVVCVETVTNVEGNSCVAGTAGMYDTINDQFYTNAGTGEFVVGVPTSFETVYVSGDSASPYIGSDTNYGFAPSIPVKSITKALDLAESYSSVTEIVLLSQITIDSADSAGYFTLDSATNRYVFNMAPTKDLTIKGQGDWTNNRLFVFTNSVNRDCTVNIGNGTNKLTFDGSDAKACFYADFGSANSGKVNFVINDNLVFTAFTNQIIYFNYSGDITIGSKKDKAPTVRDCDLLNNFITLDNTRDVAINSFVFDNSHSSGYANTLTVKAIEKSGITNTILVNNYIVKNVGGITWWNFGNDAFHRFVNKNGNVYLNNLEFSDVITSWSGHDKSFLGLSCKSGEINDVTFKNFTMANNQGWDNNSDSLLYLKGDILVNNLTLDHVDFKASRTNNNLDGIEIDSDSNVTLNNIVTKNVTRFRGGSKYFIKSRSGASLSVIGGQIDLLETNFIDFAGSATASLELHNLDFSGFVGTANGGVISATACKDLTLKNCTFSGNSAQGNGGAVYVGSASGRVEIDGCTFSGNKCVFASTLTEATTYYGGAVYIGNAKDILIKNSSFVGNTFDNATQENAICNGGAVAIVNAYEGNDSSINIEDCIFDSNIAYSAGGALYLDLASNLEGVTKNCKFLSNGLFPTDTTANTISGGAIYSAKTNIQLKDSLFNGNYCDRTRNVYGNAFGGSVCGVNSFSHCVFLNNSLKAVFYDGYNARGGAIYLGVASSMSLDDCFFENNYTSACTDATVANFTVKRDDTSYNASSVGTARLGGAVFCDQVTNVDINNCAFENNSAVKGGAVYVQYFTTMTVDHCTFDGNKTSQKSIVNQGGALYASGVSSSTGKISITNSTFQDNKSFQGGAVFLTSIIAGSVVDNCGFYRNSVCGSNNGDTQVVCGGAISGTGTLSIKLSVFEHNCAIRYGSGATIYYPVNGGAVSTCKIIDGCVFRFNDLYMQSGIGYGGSISGSAVSGVSSKNSGGYIVNSIFEYNNGYNGTPREQTGVATISGTYPYLAGGVVVRYNNDCGRNAISGNIVLIDNEKSPKPNIVIDNKIGAYKKDTNGHLLEGQVATSVEELYIAPDGSLVGGNDRNVPTSHMWWNGNGASQNWLGYCGSLGYITNPDTKIGLTIGDFGDGTRTTTSPGTRFIGALIYTSEYLSCFTLDNEIINGKKAELYYDKEKVNENAASSHKPGIWLRYVDENIDDPSNISYSVSGVSVPFDGQYHDIGLKIYDGDGNVIDKDNWADSGYNTVLFGLTRNGEGNPLYELGSEFPQFIDAGTDVTVDYLVGKNLFSFADAGVFVGQDAKLICEKRANQVYYIKNTGSTTRLSWLDLGMYPAGSYKIISSQDLYIGVNQRSSTSGTQITNDSAIVLTEASRLYLSLDMPGYSEKEIGNIIVSKEDQIAIGSAKVKISKAPTYIKQSSASTPVLYLNANDTVTQRTNSVIGTDVYGKLSGISFVDAYGNSITGSAFVTNNVLGSSNGSALNGQSKALALKFIPDNKNYAEAVTSSNISVKCLIEYDYVVYDGSVFKASNSVMSLTGLASGTTLSGILPYIADGGVLEFGATYNVTGTESVTISHKITIQKSADVTLIDVASTGNLTLTTTGAGSVTFIGNLSSTAHTHPLFTNAGSLELNGDITFGANNVSNTTTSLIYSSGDITVTGCKFYGEGTSYRDKIRVRLENSTTDRTVKFVDCEFKNFVQGAWDYPFFYVNNCTTYSLEFTRCIVDNYQGTGYGFGFIYGANGSVKRVDITDCVFSNLTNANVGLFSIKVTEGFVLKNTKILQYVARGKIGNIKGNLTIEDCDIQGVVSAEGYQTGPLFNVSTESGLSSNLVVKRSVIGNNTTSVFNGTVTGLTIEDCEFSQNDGIVVNLSGDSDAVVNISNSKFMKNRNVAVKLQNFDDITIKDSVFWKNSVTSGDGGAIYLDTATGDVEINNCEITYNTASAGNGGGVYLNAITGSVTIKDSVISNNSAGGTTGGGGVYINSVSGDVEIDNCEVSYNKITGEGSCGGGVYLADTTSALNVKNSEISNNIAYHGGGLYCSAVSNRTVTIENCEIFENVASNGNGGGMYIYRSIRDCRLIIRYNTILGNTAYENGGGICDYKYWARNNVTTTIEDCVISNNFAGSTNTTNACGGGVYSFINQPWSPGGVVYWTAISNCIIENNSVSGTSNSYGGGIYCGEFQLTITNSIIKNNNSSGNGYGGGVNCIKGAMTNCEIYYNVSKSGGGIYGGSGTIKNSRLIGNTGTNRGGAIRGAFTIRDCVFLYNSCGEGAAVYQENWSSVISDSYFLYNSGNGIIGGYGGTIDCSNCYVYYNEGNGCIISMGGASCRFLNCDIRYNTYSGDGNAVNVGSDKDGYPAIENCKILDNYKVSDINHRFQLYFSANSTITILNSEIGKTRKDSWQYGGGAHIKIAGNSKVDSFEYANNRKAATNRTGKTITISVYDNAQINKLDMALVENVAEDKVNVYGNAKVGEIIDAIVVVSGSPTIKKVGYNFLASYLISSDRIGGSIAVESGVTFVADSGYTLDSNDLDNISTYNSGADTTVFTPDTTTPVVPTLPELNLSLPNFGSSLNMVYFDPTAGTNGDGLTATTPMNAWADIVALAQTHNATISLGANWAIVAGTYDFEGVTLDAKDFTISVASGIVTIENLKISSSVERTTSLFTIASGATLSLDGVEISKIKQTTTNMISNSSTLNLTDCAIHDISFANKLVNCTDLIACAVSISGCEFYDLIGTNNYTSLLELYGAVSVLDSKFYCCYLTGGSNSLLYMLSSTTISLVNLVLEDIYMETVNYGAVIYITHNGVYSSFYGYPEITFNNILFKDISINGGTFTNINGYGLFENITFENCLNCSVRVKATDDTTFKNILFKYCETNAGSTLMGVSTDTRTEADCNISLENIEFLNTEAKISGSTYPSLISVSDANSKNIAVSFKNSRFEFCQGKPISIGNASSATLHTIIVKNCSATGMVFDGISTLSMDAVNFYGCQTSGTESSSWLVNVSAKDTAKIKNCYFVNNLGGVMKLSCPPQIEIESCFILNNYANSIFDGGLVSITGDGMPRNANIRACYFENNFSGRQSTLYIHNYKGQVNVTGCKFFANTAHSKESGYANGGALTISHCTNALVQDSTFVANSARLGGAFYIANATLSVTHCVVSKNIGSNGGAFSLANTIINIYDCKITDNDSAQGQIMYMTSNPSVVTIDSCNIHGSANNSGSIRDLFLIVVDGTSLSILNSKISNCTTGYIVSETQAIVSSTVILENVSICGNNLRAVFRLGAKDLATTSHGLTLNSCSIVGNKLTGGLFELNGTPATGGVVGVELLSCVISGNVADNASNTILDIGQYLSVDFENCVICANAGVIKNSTGTLVMTNSVLSQNYTAVDGNDLILGSLVLEGGTNEIESCYIQGNNSAYNGDVAGVLTIDIDSYELDGIIVRGNTIDGTATAILNNGDANMISNLIAYGNGGVGGAVLKNFGVLKLVDFLIYGNEFDDYGPIYVGNGGILSILSGEAYGNIANRGAVFFVGENGSLTIINGKFYGNEAVTRGTAPNNILGSGGVIYNLGFVNINDGMFGYDEVEFGTPADATEWDAICSNWSNKAQNGGVIYNLGTFVINGGTFAYNISHVAGGVIYNGTTGDLVINNAKLIRNDAGLKNESGVWAVDDSITATGKAIFNGGTLLVQNITCTENGAKSGFVGDGGDFYCDTGSTTNILGGTFTDSKANKGAFIYLAENTKAYVANAKMVVAIGNKDARATLLNTKGEAELYLDNCYITSNSVKTYMQICISHGMSEGSKKLVSLKNCVIENYYVYESNDYDGSAGYGALFDMYNGQQVIFDDCEIINNLFTRLVHVKGQLSYLKIVNSKIEDNSPVYNWYSFMIGLYEESTALIETTKFNKNSTSGIIVMEHKPNIKLYVSNCDFYKNYGYILNMGGRGTVVFKDCNITENDARDINNDLYKDKSLFRFGRATIWDSYYIDVKFLGKNIIEDNHSQVDSFNFENTLAQITIGYGGKLVVKKNFNAQGDDSNIVLPNLDKETKDMAKWCQDIILGGLIKGSEIHLLLKDAVNGDMVVAGYYENNDFQYYLTTSDLEKFVYDDPAYTLQLDKANNCIRLVAVDTTAGKTQVVASDKVVRFNGMMQEITTDDIKIFVGGVEKDNEFKKSNYTLKFGLKQNSADADSSVVCDLDYSPKYVARDENGGHTVYFKLYDKTGANEVFSDTQNDGKITIEIVRQRINLIEAPTAFVENGKTLNEASFYVGRVVDDEGYAVAGTWTFDSGSTTGAQNTAYDATFTPASKDVYYVNALTTKVTVNFKFSYVTYKTDNGNTGFFDNATGKFTGLTKLEEIVPKMADGGLITLNTTYYFAKSENIVAKGNVIIRASHTSIAMVQIGDDLSYLEGSQGRRWRFVLGRNSSNETTPDYAITFGGSGKIIFDGQWNITDNWQQCLFFVDDGCSLTFNSNVYIQSFYKSGNDGGQLFENHGNLTFNGSTIKNNGFVGNNSANSGVRGGFVYNTGNVVFAGTKVVGNSYQRIYGGLVRNNGGHVVFSGGTYTNNSSSTWYGGTFVYNENDGVVEIYGGLFFSNTLSSVTEAAALFYNVGGTMVFNGGTTIANSTVSSNDDSVDGVIIFNGTALAYNSSMGIRAIETDSAVVKDAGLNLVLTLGMVAICACGIALAFSTSLKAKRGKK